MIACQWAKALGAKLIGTVGNAQKAQIALQAGAWQVINYREESIVERVKEVTGGKKCGWSMTQWERYLGSLIGLFTASRADGQLW